jgi:hypothetical protein
MGVGTRRVDTRQHAGIGERDQSDGQSAEQDRSDIRIGDPRDGERRQALRQRAEYSNVCTLVQIQHADHEGRRDYRDQDARQELAALEQQNYRKRAGADAKCSPVGAAFEHRGGDGPKIMQRSGVFDREAEQLGQLADQHGECNAVHVAVADRLGQQFGDKTQARQAGEDANQP